ncbi:unnamed protein product [Closterium sp. NIES-53]
MHVEMASWKSIGTYVDAVSPLGANIVDGMWIFRVKQPPGSPPVFKARYVARSFSQRQGVDYVHTFSPTPKMTTLWVLLHVAAQRDYKLHSLDFSTAFLQGSLHEEIWLRRPPGFTGSFPPGTQWSLRRPVCWCNPTAITSKWLFKIKSDADGKIERYKSRLVAKGYQQKEKVDYKELFAPVVKPTTLRTLLAGAAIKGWVVKQMDVTTAFLNGVLEEEIFMAQPEGFDDGSGRFLRLKKALYGLKQAPRQWYLKLRGFLEEIGFTPSTADHSLFMLGKGEQRSFMVVYVDDILIFSPSSDLVKEVMLKLQDKFKCKALGDVSFYLGLHIERDVEKRCMRVHQRKYLEALAANFGQSDGHVATPFPSGFNCVKGPEEESVGEEERRRFHSLVGSLMYAAVNTRPDVAFATGQFARVVQCPNEEQVRGCCATSAGYTFSLSSGSVSWRSTCSSSVLCSSCEAEIYAGAMAALELRWLTYLLTDLGEAPRSPPVLYVDNKAMLALCQEHRLEHRTKHIALRYFLARELQQRGQLRLAYVATRANTADIFSKALQPCDHQRFCTMLGLVPTWPHLLTS